MSPPNLCCLALLLGVLACAASGCDGPSPGGGDRSAAEHSGGERLARARDEMGLSSTGEDGDEEGEEDAREVELGVAMLPSWPRDVDVEEAPADVALERARAVLSAERPVPSDALEEAAFQRWVENDYAAWIRAHGEELRRAREALAPMEQGELGEYVVASALIGELFARFAEAIATMPLPTRIEEDDGERLRFRQAFLVAAAPLWDRAADAFGACASATVRARDASLARWQRFCDERGEDAQAAPRPID